MARFWKRFMPGGGAGNANANSAEKLNNENSLEDHLAELEHDVREKHREETDFFKRKLTGEVTRVTDSKQDRESGHV